MTVVRSLLLVAVLLGTFAASRGDDAAPKQAAPQVADDFTDKVLFIFLDARMRDVSMALSHAEIKEIGGRTFLVGTGADTQRESDWWAGKKIRISWPLVSGYVTLTAEEYAQYIKDSKEDD